MTARSVCPNCGEPLKRIRVVYGYPAPELFDRAERGEVVLGGCGVTGDDPKYACSKCHEPMTVERRR